MKTRIKLYEGKPELFVLLALILILPSMAVVAFLGKIYYQSPSTKNTHDYFYDSNGFLLQGTELDAVGFSSVTGNIDDIGKEGWRYLQIEVDGDQNSPFTLCMNSSIRFAGYHTPAFQYSDIDPDPNNHKAIMAAVFFSKQEIDELETPLRKASEWGDLAAKENLDVDRKSLFSSHKLNIDFERKRDSEKFYVVISFPSSGSIILDKSGVEKMLSLIANLPARRDGYLAYVEKREKLELKMAEEAARVEAQKTQEAAREDASKAEEKAKVDSILK